MHQLIYISTAQRGLTENDAQEILTVSQRNNGGHKVSGLLLFDDRRFLQALEGDEAAVTATFERVKADPRHRAIVLLSTKIIEQRQFGGWSMAWQRIDPTAPAGEFRDAVAALTANVTDASTRELFRGFSQIDRKAA